MKSMSHLLECDGRKFSATIRGTYVEGTIIVDKTDGFVYLCQNEKKGRVPTSRSIPEGYKYSWCVRRGSQSDLRGEDVADLVLLDSSVFSTPGNDSLLLLTL